MSYYDSKWLTHSHNVASEEHLYVEIEVFWSANKGIFCNLQLKWFRSLVESLNMLRAVYLSVIKYEYTKLETLVESIPRLSTRSSVDLNLESLHMIQVRQQSNLVIHIGKWGEYAPRTSAHPCREECCLIASLYFQWEYMLYWVCGCGSPIEISLLVDTLKNHFLPRLEIQQRNPDPLSNQHWKKEPKIQEPTARDW
jgi:hypothetical protein